MKGLHALPVYVNLMNNAILRSNLDNLTSPEAEEYGMLCFVSGVIGVWGR